MPRNKEPSACSSAAHDGEGAVLVRGRCFLVFFGGFSFQSQCKVGILSEWHVSMHEGMHPCVWKSLQMQVWLMQFVSKNRVEFRTNRSMFQETEDPSACLSAIHYGVSFEEICREFGFLLKDGACGSNFVFFGLGRKMARNDHLVNRN